MKKTLSLFLTLALGVVLTVPAFADIQYADKGGNYTVVTDATLNGGIQREVYGNVAAVWENLSYDPATGQTNTNGTGFLHPWHIVKADASGYHSISDWYQEIGGFCESGFAAAQNFDGKWGILNAEGRVVVEFKFDEMKTPTDDGYAVGVIDGKYTLLNLKTGDKTALSESTEGYNNGLMAVYSHDEEYRNFYYQYVGLNGKTAFLATANDGSIYPYGASVFKNGYAIVKEAAQTPKEGGGHSMSSPYCKIIDTNGNVLLTDHGDDYHSDSWRDGDFYLDFMPGWGQISVVSEEGIIAVNFPKVTGANSSTAQYRYIDLSGNIIPALANFKPRTDSGLSPTSFHHGYAVATKVGANVCRLIDANGTEFFSFHDMYPVLSNVSNSGFCWAIEESGQGKDDGYGSKDRILGVIQVPVTESPTPEPVSAPVQSGQFADVSPDAYYADAVNWAVARGVTNGVSATNFAPADTCTRGQVATFLWRANGSPEPVTTENPFTDVDPSSAFYKAILWAAENGITAGTSESTFSPGNPCTRAHVVTFLWRAQGRPAPSGEGSLADSFPQGYYTDAVRWADAAGLLSGTGEAFTPSALCPRADIVTYLYRNLA